MASKQLEIVVEARDEATATFGKVGDGATRLGERMHGIEEVGHGLSKSLRGIHHAILAFELVPIGLDAIGALFKTLASNADQAAEAQRGLINSLKELPIVGKAAGAAAEYLGDAMAKAFGTQTTKDLEAEVAAQKKALSDYATEAPKIGQIAREQMDAATLAGMGAGDQAVERARQKASEVQRKLAEEAVTARRAIIQMEAEEAQHRGVAQDDRGWAFNGISDGDRAAAKQQADLILQQRMEAEGQIKQLNTARLNSEKVLAAELRAEQFKELQSEQSFDDAQIALKLGHQQQLASIASATLAIELRSGNRDYSAGLESLKSAGEKEVAEIEAAGLLKVQALRKQEEAEIELGRAAYDDPEIKEKHFKKSQEFGAAGDDEKAATDAKVKAAREQSEASANALRQNQIRSATLEILRSEGAAGNAAARIQAERLELTLKQDAAEHALQAIAEDAKATTQQQVDAKRQLFLLSQSKAEKQHNDILQSGLSILERQAAMGDVTAQLKADAIKLTIEQQAAEAKLADIAANGNNSAKELAQSQLAQLRAIPSQQKDNTIRDEGLFVLQQEAALGDKNAERQLKKIELERKFGDERKRSLAILQDEHSTADQKAKAKTLLGSLDAVQKRAMQQLGGPEGQAQKATLVEEHYLSGRTAGIGQEKDQFAPIVDAQNKNKAVNESIRDLLKDFLAGLQAGGRVKKVT